MLRLRSIFIKNGGADKITVNYHETYVHNKLHVLDVGTIRSWETHAVFIHKNFEGGEGTHYNYACINDGRAIINGAPGKSIEMRIGGDSTKMIIYPQSSHFYNDLYMEGGKAITFRSGGYWHSFGMSTNTLTLTCHGDNSAWGHFQLKVGNTAGGASYHQHDFGASGVTLGSDVTVKGNFYVEGAMYAWVNGWSYIASDDRLKLNEKNISDASPLLKLRPQVYDKLTAFDGNVEDATFESGLIAQEIWYDCPELRHLIHVGEGGSPSDVVETSSDPSVDPDYSSWGSKPASVNYTGFIPYLIRGFQEQQAEIQALKSEITSLRKMFGSGNVDSV